MINFDMRSINNKITGLSAPKHLLVYFEGNVERWKKETRLIKPDDKKTYNRNISKQIQIRKATTTESGLVRSSNLFPFGGVG